MSFAIPTNRLRDTDELVAFNHPMPSYRTHILILPKRDYRSLIDLSDEDTDFMSALISTVKSLVDEFDLEKQGYRLIVNGGPAQDVKLLHFHLVSADLQEPA